MANARILQRRAWDCGLACVATVLGVQIDLDTLEQLCGVTSVWSIDLAYLLHRLGVPTTYCTTCLGANQDHKTNSYYAHDFDSEEVRVNRLFAEAAAHGVDIRKQRLSYEELRAPLADGAALIVLVNANVLRHARRGLPIYDGLEYGGHFIVLTGYRTDTDAFVYWDPSRAVDPNLPPDVPLATLDYSVSRDVFERARSWPGTDDDVLIIRMPSESAAPQQ